MSSAGGMRFWNVEFAGSKRYRLFAREYCDRNVPKDGLSYYMLYNREDGYSKLLAPIWIEAHSVALVCEATEADYRYEVERGYAEVIFGG